ncbi:MAG: S1 RNA-binding domain-containing protein [Clostridiales bacterium]|jgi:general stress protein 13/S1 RNA binding domain protein|nr:S1 RNA-binding domain-containing protein [Clostridiales bacterium]
MSEENSISGAIVGQIYTGKVLKIKPFGAIVSLPNSAPGLVHISQIANGFIQSVSDVLNIGDEVDVRVVSSDPASGKISLSMKDVPQRFDPYGDEESEDDDYSYHYAPPVIISAAAAASFEEKFKSWQKLSNERIAGINRRNKRNKRR